MVSYTLVGMAEIDDGRPQGDEFRYETGYAFIHGGGSGTGGIPPSAGR